MAAKAVVVLRRGLIGSLSWTTRHLSALTRQKQSLDDSKWVTLPPFTATDTLTVGKGNQLSSSTTALKWVLRCCPNLPRTLVHKLFRLRQDPALLVLNKPPGMPVQGGINIKWSLDAVAAACLNYEYSEPPRLVHRLDRDCSGILVMGRTQTSATLLHSIFREKTSRASDNIGTEKTILQRRYLALVIGCPRRPRGLVTASLGKVVVDNGKSDRITIIDKSTLLSSQHAITKYQVVGSSSNGYTWLELFPLTGRKHQLRVHCAEVLGTPIVGDYKYGWQAHKKWGLLSNVEDSSEEILKEETLPLGLNLNKGSISEKHPRLHLHCKQVVMPNVSQALQNVESASSYDLSRVESLELVAALPPYMQRSWDIMNS